MKLKLLFLFTLITVVNTFSQTIDNFSLRIEEGIYAGSVNMISNEFTVEGTSFKIQAVVTPSSDVVSPAVPSIVSNASDRWGVDDASFDGHLAESAVINSISIVDFNANGTGYTASAISEMYFKSITIRGANGHNLDSPKITVNGTTNPGEFIIGKTNITTETISFGVSYTNSVPATMTVGGINDVTSITLANTNSSFRDSWQIIGTDVEFVFSGTTWTGTTDSDWTDATNWSNGVPTASADVIIPSGLTNQPIIGSAVAVNNLSVDGASSLTISSGGSLIVNGTSTGDVTYKRNLGTSNWYLVSSPVSGEIMTDMRANNSFANGTGGSRIGFAPYTTADDTWSYFTTSSIDALDSGAGYSAKLNASGDISFIGTINTADVDASVSFAGNGFNLIGNPYAAHINSKTFLDANTNLDQTQLWVWNQANGMYEVKTNANAFILAPAQGFFVKANSGTEVTFPETNQLGTGGTFQKSATTEVKLLMSNGKSNRFAKIYYSNNLTKGFDAGWEGEVFAGIPNNLSVFTNLVEDNQGKKYQVQSLPLSEIESIIIPIGVKAEAGEITFSAEALNLPNDVKVYLEDRATNTYTSLDEVNSVYKVALTEALDGVGRFYLHTRASSVLSTDADLLNSVSVFNTNGNLRITGLSKGNAKVKVFNILGKNVFNTSFNVNTTVKEITLPNLSTGVYVVQLQTESGRLNKKIILE